jgi:uncharacterized protein (TIGR03435 family)
MTPRVVARVGKMFVGIVGMLVISGLASPPQGFAQPSDASMPKFEVASIRPAEVPPGARVCTGRSTTDAGHFERSCLSLRELLWRAGMPENRLVAPDWMESSQKFDVSAKLPSGATEDQIPQMILSLLEDRFGLVFHREFRDRPVQALVVSKGGLKVQPPLPESEQPAWVAAAANNPVSARPFAAGKTISSFSVSGPDGVPMSILQSPSMGFVRRSVGKSDGIVRYEAPSITFEGLADLAVMAGTFLDTLVVVDMTGLKGHYQLNLDISQPDLSVLMAARAQRDRDAEQGEYLRVVQDGLKKLGLQLEPRKAPVELFVIDHLEKTPTEN